MTYRVGIDTGSTFTDLVAFREDTGKFRRAKASSTPKEPAKAVMAALKKAKISADEIDSLVYGSTVALNALIERKGPRLGYLTNEGLPDLIFIQQGNKPGPYALQWQKPKPFVSRNDCREVAGRIDYRGRVVQPLNLDQLEEAIDYFEAKGIQHIAVCLLFSFANPAHEQKAREAILARLPDATVSLSHEVFPQWREYQRASTTIADAFVKQLLGQQVDSLQHHLGADGQGIRLLIMKSNGGVMSADTAYKHPISTVRSGPVGGVLGARFFARLLGKQNAITIDVGGTSCDASMIVNDDILYTDEHRLYWGISIKSPMLEVLSVGAAGGSIAWIDKGGLLQVGPRSAGGDPGPVCYQRGGIEPTVTDANLLLGYLGEDQLLGGEIHLHLDASKAALEDLGQKLKMSALEVASAIHEIANNLMVNAVHEISIGRGIDPAEFALFPFGGAGPIHAASVGWNLGVSEVIVPPFPGVMSAFGLLTADLRVDHQRTVHFRSDKPRLSELNKQLEEMLAAVVADIREDGFTGEPELSAALEMRYYGQNYGTDIFVAAKELTENELTAAFDRFHQSHEEFHGYRFSEEPIEIICLKGAAVGQIPQPLPTQAPSPETPPSPRTTRDATFEEVGTIECPVYLRNGLPAGFSTSGPLIIEEVVATTLVPPYNDVSVDEYGCLHLQQTQ